MPRLTNKRLLGLSCGILLLVAGAAVIVEQPGIAEAQSGYRVCGSVGKEGVYLVKVGKDDHKMCSDAKAQTAKLAGDPLIFQYTMQTCESISNQHFYQLTSDFCTYLAPDTGIVYLLGGAGEYLHQVGDVIPDL